MTKTKEQEDQEQEVLRILNDSNDIDELQQDQQQQQRTQSLKQQHQGSLILQPGQKLWSYNMISLELAEVDLQRSPATGRLYHSKIVIDPDCIYVPAINRKNAARKVMKHFGIFYSKTGIIHTDARVEKVKKLVHMTEDGHVFKEELMPSDNNETKQSDNDNTGSK